MMDLPRPCLCLVTDRNQCEGRPLEDVVDKAVEGGVNMVQLRDKDLTARQLYSLAVRIREVIDGRALLIVNDRVDVALACGADGVQLGEEGMPLDAARRVLGNGLLIGRSVHSIEGAVSAEANGADFLIAGTIFPTNSHPGGPTSGVGFLEELGWQVRIPFLGIGGINSDNAGSVVFAGAAGVAMITGITKSPDPRNAAKELIQVMTRSAALQSGQGLARKQ